MTPTPIACWLCNGAEGHDPACPYLVPPVDGPMDHWIDDPIGGLGDQDFIGANLVAALGLDQD